MNLFFHIGFGGFHGGRGGLIRFGRGFIDDFFRNLLKNTMGINWKGLWRSQSFSTMISLLQQIYPHKLKFQHCFQPSSAYIFPSFSTQLLFPLPGWTERHGVLVCHKGDDAPLPTTQEPTTPNTGVDWPYPPWDLMTNDERQHLNKISTYPVCMMYIFGEVSRFFEISTPAGCNWIAICANSRCLWRMVLID